MARPATPSALALARAVRAAAIFEAAGFAVAAVHADLDGRPRCLEAMRAG
ncbi:MAG: hypothetical protein AAFU61_02175 [Pseudomonadota bacterium]